MAEFIDAASLFQQMDGDRSSTMDRAVLCSELTIPYLLRDDSASAQDDLSREYVQGFGAKLVNHLVGKFAISILPPSQPFYRLSPTQEAMEAITQGDSKAQMEIEKILAMKEEGILRYINKSKFRASLYPALRLAMVTGDTIIEKTDEDTFRVFNLNNYVIERDYSGKVVTLIIKELLDAKTLPEEISYDGDVEDEDVELYTVVQFMDGGYVMHQELGDDVVGTEQSFDKLSDRFISLRWSKVDDEDYGRSFVEEHLGTFISLNKQLTVLNETAVVSSKTVFTVNPNGTTKYKDYVEAGNGDAIVGSEVDIGTVKVQKAGDLQLTYNLIQDYKKELAEAFLMGSAAIRDAERVTAHEVQLVASELEASFGGVYTAIAEDIQMPLIESAMSTLKIDGGDDVDVIITAGVEALGRNIELNKLNNLLQELGLLAGLVGAESVAPIINVSSVASSMVVNSGVAGKNFLYTEDEVSERTGAAKQEELACKALESAAVTAGTNVIDNTQG